MEATIKKWGNSAAVRIPAAILTAARTGLDQKVDVREEAGRIVIEPVRPRPKYLLKDLVAKCDRRKRRTRAEQAWLDAPPAGREVF